MIGKIKYEINNRSLLLWVLNNRQNFNEKPELDYFKIETGNRKVLNYQNEVL